MIEFRREAVFHRGGVDIRLEGRAGLAERLGGAVELAGAVVAPADDGAHGAAGFHDYHRAFGNAVFLAVLAQIEFDRFFGGALQIHVDRGVRDHRAHTRLGGQPLHLLEGPVEEIVRALAVTAVDDVGRVETRLQHLAVGHEAALHKVGKHDVGARAGRRQIDVRGVFRRRLEQTGKHRRLGEVQILDRLAVVEVGSRGDAERAAAHVGAVEIELQNLFLGKVHLEPDGEEGFLDLALDGALVGQEEVLGELLREARTALHHGVGAHVFRHGADQPQKVDAVMLEEASVLGGEHRLDDVVGHLVDRDRFALDDAALADLVALAVEEGDGEIVLRAPVALGLDESGERQRQHDDAPGRAHREAFAEHLERCALPAGVAEAAEEYGERFPDLAGLEAGLVERRIDPRVDRHQARGFRALRFARWQWAIHLRLRPARACFRH